MSIREDPANLLNGVLQISDFFGAYPEIDNPNFNSLISRKTEFYELRPGTTEPPPARGQGYKHQKFAVRYLTWYDRLFLLHEPGTGKSCIIAHSAELFKDEYLKDPNDPTKIRRAVIIVRNRNLASAIKHEIVCRCTDRVYETKLVLDSPDLRTMKSNITAELKTWYDILTFHEFAKIIENFKREEDLEEYMSNKVFYVDEAHNVPTLEDIRSNQPPVLDIREAEEYKSRLGTDPQGKIQGFSEYQTMFRAFHKGKRNKIVLATATPMINSPLDIVPLFNLILPLEQQVPRIPSFEAKEEEDFINRPLSYFEPYFRGRVSYVRSLQTGTIENPQGVKIEGKETWITTCHMSPFQYYAYLKAAKQEEESASFYLRRREASNFVFPDGSIGKSGFEQYIEKVGDRYQFQKTPEGQLLAKNIKNEDYLKKLSMKYWNILDLCRTSIPSDPLNITDDKGVVFVYFDEFVHGSGLIVLALILQAYGYEEFLETRNVFIGGQDLSRGPCASSLDTETERPAREGFQKKPRFAILTSDTPQARIDAILNTLNSYENRHGEYIQVVLGSRISGEGINIFNAVKMIMAVSSWNYSSNYQARERVFRSISHLFRIREKKAKLALQGIPTDNLVFEVKTYNMASIYEYDPSWYQETLETFPEFARLIKNEQELETLLKTTNYELVDPQMYLLAEVKDRRIRQIIRYLKQSSVDCHINYERNVRSTDLDGSPVCDYAKCKYECAGINPNLLTPLDWTTKILYYSDQEVARAQQEIKEIFSKFYSLKIGQVHQLVQKAAPELEKIFVVMALEKMIRENTVVLDRLGFNSYLRESPDGVIYLEKDPFETRALPENTAYNSVLIGSQDIHNNSLLDYLTGRSIIMDAGIINQLITLPTDSPQFLTLLNNLSTTSKVDLLETALHERLINKFSYPLYDAIISIFNYSVFYMNEPIDLLNKAKTQLANQGKTRGRKPNPGTRPKLKRLELGVNLEVPDYDPYKTGEKVYLHTLLNQEGHARTDYGATVRYFNAEGKIRILKLSEGIGWRDVNDYEHITYNTLIRQQINEIRSYYEQFPIYGIMLPPKNEFRLRDRQKEGPEAAKDARKVYEGRICQTWNKHDLIDVMYRLKIPLPANFKIPPNLTREAMITSLTKEISLEWEKTSDDQLRYFYLWYNNNLNYHRKDICDYIRDYLDRKGMLLTGRKPPSYQGNLNPGGSINVAPSLIGLEYSSQSTKSVSSESLVSGTPLASTGEVTSPSLTSESRFSVPFPVRPSIELSANSGPSRSLSKEAKE